jgi:hypothetical protein
MARRSLLLLVAVALVAACSDDGSGDDDGATLGDTAPGASVTAPEVPAASPAGSGAVVIGGSQSPFTVTECQLEAADDPITLVLLTGAGTTGSGVPFQVEVQRVATSTAAAETFTDTIT